MGTDLIYGLLPEHLLLALVLVLMVLECFRADRRLAAPLFTLVLAAGCLVLCRQLAAGYAGEPVAGEIALDRLVLLARLALLCCGLVLGLCFHEPLGSFKARMLLASSLLGGMIMMSSTGFISLFIGIEMLSLPAFALMVHGCGDSVAGEGAFKYLVLSSVATVCILFGASLSYHVTGSLALGSFAASLRPGGPLMFGAAALVLAGFLLKAALFPFHGWAPDAYAGSRLPVTAFLASVVKGAVVLALARVFGAAGSDPLFASLIAPLCMVSVCYGNLAAIRQTSFKRMLAYSSIAHAGYMVYALADVSGGALETIIYYVCVYALTTVLACACFAMLVGDGDGELGSVEGAFHARPVPALLLALALLSLAGIPPLPGFFAKLFVFRSVIASGHLASSVVVLFGSYLGVFYYLRMIFLLFKPAAQSRERAGDGSSLWMRGGVLIGSLVLLYFLVCPQGLSVGLAPARTASHTPGATVASLAAPAGGTSVERLSAK